MSHGHHWGALVPDTDTFFAVNLREAVAQGRLVEDIDRARQDPFYVAIVVLNRIPSEDRSEVVSAYPYLARGASIPFEILSIIPDDDEYSAEFEGTLELLMKDGFSLTVCDPLYCLNRLRYTVAEKYEFSLAALAYHFEHLENTDLVITEGPLLDMERENALKENPQADVSTITSVTVSMAGLRTVIPTENGDAEFQSVIEDTGRCDFEGIPVYWVRVYLRPKDEAELPCILYVSEQVLNGYVPRAGDTVRGVAWLQAVPLKPLERSASWADELPEIDREASFQGMQRAIEAEEYLAGLPLGVFELAKGMIAAGWEVTRYANPDGSTDMPAFLVERRDERINVWVRSWIDGEEAAGAFSPEEKRKFAEKSATNGPKAVYVTVQLHDTDSGYRFSYDGTDDLEAVMGPLRLVEYMRKPESAE